jgi:hypothetical protein
MKKIFCWMSSYYRIWKLLTYAFCLGKRGVKLKSKTQWNCVVFLIPLSEDQLTIHLIIIFCYRGNAYSIFKGQIYTSQKNIASFLNSYLSTSNYGLLTKFAYVPEHHICLFCASQKWWHMFLLDIILIFYQKIIVDLVIIFEKTFTLLPIGIPIFYFLTCNDATAKLHIFGFQKLSFITLVCL